MFAKLIERVRYRWRSSITGRWVTAAFAKLHPDTTQREKSK